MSDIANLDPNEAGFTTGHGGKFQFDSLGFSSNRCGAELENVQANAKRPDASLCSGAS